MMASNDYALNLVGDISKYQAELEKVPGFTQRTAASAAVKMAAEMSKGQEQAAQNAIRAAERTAAAQTAAAEKAAAAQIAASERAAKEQIQEAEKVASARAKLESTAASGNAQQAALLAYKNQREAIEELGRAVKDEELTEKALNAIDAKFADEQAARARSLAETKIAELQRVVNAQIAAENEAASATRSLEDFAARGNASDQLTLSFTRQQEEIMKLGKASGDTALTQKALAQSHSEYQKNLNNYNDSLGGTAGAGQKAGDGLNAAAAAGQNLRFQIADVFTSLAGGSNPLIVLSQQGPQIVEAFGGASDAMEVFEKATFGIGPALIPIAVAVGALMVAYAAMTAEMARAEAQTEMLRAAKKALEPVTNRQRDAELDLAVALGKMNEAQLKATKAQLAAQSGVEDFADAQAEQRKEYQSTIENMELMRDVANKGLLGQLPGVVGRFGTSINVVGRGVFDLADNLLGLSENAELAQRGLSVLDENLLAAQQAIKGTRETTEELILANEKKDKADKARDDANKARAAEQERMSALRDQMIGQIQAEEAANTALAEILAGMGDQPDKIEAEYQARIALISALDGQIEAQRLLDAMGEAEYARDLERYEVTRLNLEESTRYAVEAQGEIQRAIDQTIAKQAQQRQALLSGTADLSAAVMGATQFMLDQQVAATGKASKRLYRIYQASALATIIARTAEGIVTAASLPPPVDAIKFAAVGIANATALAQLATAKPPAFDIGGTVGSGPRGGGGIGAQTPDQVIIRALPGERVQSREEVAQRQVGPQIQVVAMPVYQHFGLFARDAVRQPGSLRTAIRQGRPTYAGGY